MQQIRVSAGQSFQCFLYPETKYNYDSYLHETANWQIWDVLDTWSSNAVR